MQYEKSVRISLWSVRLFLGALAALLFFVPKLIDWYIGLRAMPTIQGWAIIVCFYLCAPAVAVALGVMHRLLLRIMQGQVFIRDNVKLIRMVSGCCAIVSAITLAGCFIYAPLVFVVVLMAFLCMMVRVIASVLDAAAALREENDLTI